MSVRHTEVDRSVHVDAHGHGGYHGGYGYHHHHPVARAAGAAAVVATTAAVTAAVVGSIVYTLPTSCTTIISGEVTYQQCGSTYYRPQYVGSSVQYVVVEAP